MGFYVFIGVLVIFVLILLKKSLIIVRQSEVAIIERLGKYLKTAKSGLNVIVPILDRVSRRVDLRTQVLDSPPQPVITKDNVTMSIDTVLYYQITDPFKSTYEIANLVMAIRYLTTTTLRDIIGTMELDSTLSSREDINTRLRLLLDEATDKWGVRVERVEVKNIDLPADIKNAMEKQMRAEREKRAQILQAEGEKQAAITQAEGQKGAVILQAQADKESKILAAEAEKASQVTRAEGEANAINLIAEAEAAKNVRIYNSLHESRLDDEILRLKSIEATVEMARSDNKVFVPYESVNVLGAAGMATDIIKGTKAE